MPPKTTTWSLEPHTQGKHLVLKHYMDAWLAIMASSNSNILFIDAFAGPGEYSQREPGSPLIATNALISHKAKSRMGAGIHFLFIESDEARADYLQKVLEQEQPKNKNYYTYDVINSTFDETLTDVLGKIEEHNAQLAPSFVMIDPFGLSHTPMKTIGRILANEKSEVYIIFMYRALNRWGKQQQHASHIDELFGCADWRQRNEILDVRERKNFTLGLYKDQLKKNGAKYILHFEVVAEDNQLEYAIFFGSSNLKGCDEMKKAIWKAAPLGDFRFRGGQNNQLTFGPKIIDFEPLKNALRKDFGSREWVKIEEVIDFVMSDKTEFHSGHLKTKTLKPMENDGQIEVKPRPGRKAGTYPDGTVLRFVES